jgi:hypothetical protein
MGFDFTKPSYELTFIVVLVGVIVLTCVFISQLNNKFAVILTLPGLAVFTFYIISQIDRLGAGQWTLWDIIIVAAICFIMIWFYPDVRDIIIRWRGRNKN